MNESDPVVVLRVVGDHLARGGSGARRELAEGGGWGGNDGGSGAEVRCGVALHRSRCL